MTKLLYIDNNVPQYVHRQDVANKQLKKSSAFMRKKHNHHHHHCRSSNCSKHSKRRSFSESDLLSEIDNALVLSKGFLYARGMSFFNSIFFHSFFFN